METLIQILHAYRQLTADIITAARINFIRDVNNFCQIAAAVSGCMFSDGFDDFTIIEIQPGFQPGCPNILMPDLPGLIQSLRPLDFNPVAGGFLIQALGAIMQHPCNIGFARIHAVSLGQFYCQLAH